MPTDADVKIAALEARQKMMLKLVWALLSLQLGGGLVTAAGGVIGYLVREDTKKQATQIETLYDNSLREHRGEEPKFPEGPARP